MEDGNTWLAVGVVRWWCLSCVTLGSIPNGADPMVAYLSGVRMCRLCSDWLMRLTNIAVPQSGTFTSHDIFWTAWGPLARNHTVCSGLRDRYHVIPPRSIVVCGSLYSKAETSFDHLSDGYPYHRKFLTMPTTVTVTSRHCFNRMANSCSI